MLPDRWNAMLRDPAFRSGMARIRRIRYGAGFLYSLAHQLKDPKETHSLESCRETAPGGNTFLDVLEILTQRAEASNCAVEFTFTNLPEDARGLCESVGLQEFADRFRGMVDGATPEERGEIMALELDFHELYQP